MSGPQQEFHRFRLRHLVQTRTTVVGSSTVYAAGPAPDDRMRKLCRPLRQQTLDVDASEQVCVLHDLPRFKQLVNRLDAEQIPDAVESLEER